MIGSDFPLKNKAFITDFKNKRGFMRLRIGKNALSLCKCALMCVKVRKIAKSLQYIFDPYNDILKTIRQQ
jgi:hypothetical protein